MKEKWKDIFLGVVTLIVIILATMKGIDILLITGLAMDSANVATIFGSIMGGIISGGLTLLGVIMAFKFNKLSSLSERYYSTRDDLSQFTTFIEMRVMLCKAIFQSSNYDEINLLNPTRMSVEFENSIAKLDKELLKLLGEFNDEILLFITQMATKKTLVKTNGIDLKIENTLIRLKRIADKILARYKFIETQAS